ncbi:hypothetical protein KBA73_04515 [Patescibacteria group bacterium]|nr:hypothetical protein [Patescibacteria group bacterium]
MTDLQHQVLQMYRQARVQVSSGVEGVQTLVSDDSTRLNAALAEYGWDIRLPSFGPPNVGSVSLFKRAMTWFQPGEIKSITLANGGERVAATKLRGGYDTYSDSRTRALDAIRIRTTGTDIVWLVPYKGPQLEGVSLLAAAAARVRSFKERSDIKVGTDVGCFFPMVDLRHTPSIDFLNGMRMTGESGGVLGAMIQENILQMDEKGARVESATAGMLYRSISRNVIDGPFLFVLERDGLIDFVALCAEDSFRNPHDGKPLVLRDEDVIAVSMRDTPIVSIPYPPPVEGTRPAIQVTGTTAPVSRGSAFTLFV